MNLVFDKFMVMVVACNMFTMAQMLSYRATIHWLAEKLRHEQRPEYITEAFPILYDTIFRKCLA